MYIIKKIGIIIWSNLELKDIKCGIIRGLLLN